MNPSYSVISFPSLGLELNPPRYFSIGSMNIYYYGVIFYEDKLEEFIFKYETNNDKQYYYFNESAQVIFPSQNIFYLFLSTSFNA